MISKKIKKVFNLGGPPLSDPKRGEAFYTVPKHCDLKKKVSSLRSRFFSKFFLFFLTCYRRHGATINRAIFCVGEGHFLMYFRRGSVRPHSSHPIKTITGLHYLVFKGKAISKKRLLL